MNSCDKGKRGEREFSALLRTHGFDARRGQQFSGSPDSPDVVSDALVWMHIEIKRVQHLNLAKACAQAKRDAEGKPWIVAHRRNRGPWMVTMDDRELYGLLRKAVPFLDLWPFTGPRPITLDAEVFFQFLRVFQSKTDADTGQDFQLDSLAPASSALNGLSPAANFLSRFPSDTNLRGELPLQGTAPVAQRSEREDKPTEKPKQTEQ